MRVAIYARYSTDKQSAASADDQIRDCRTYADRQGWTVVDVFADAALSGATRDRPALNALLLRAGEFDLVLAESIDRLSRDQEDIAAIHKRLCFAGAQLVTLADGAVGEIHIGLKGTMAALFLADLGQKTRRGQIGRVVAGRIPGGLSYGYRKVRRNGPDDEPERGLRAIDEVEAAIVRRIFDEYLQGVSAFDIAARLNAEQVPSPRGGEWRQNTIVGHHKRRNGILNNALYAGEILFNRQRMVRDPVTRKRVSRANPPEDWIRKDVPELRIVNAETFEAVQQRLAASSTRTHYAHRRPRRLFSGLVVCADCGGPVSIITGDRWGCSAFKQKGTCGNGRTIGNRQLEKRLLGALREQMLAPDVVHAYVAEYHRRRAEAQKQAPTARRALERRIGEIERTIGRAQDGYEQGLYEAAEAKQRIGPLREEIAQLRAQLAAEPLPPKVVEMNSTVAQKRYRAAIERLVAELETKEAPAYARAKDGLRALIDVVTLHPREGERGVNLELRGRLAELLAMAQKKPAPAKGAGELYVGLVAGARFGHCSTIATTWC